MENLGIKLKRKVLDILLRVVWKLADDAMYTCEYLKDIYLDPPEDIADESVGITTIYHFNPKYRKEILDWIDDEL